MINTCKKWFARIIFLFVAFVIVIAVLGNISQHNKDDIAINDQDKPTVKVKAETIENRIPIIVGGMARNYEITSNEDLDVGGKKRHRWFIVSDTAQSFSDRAATVIKAAIDLKQQTRTDEAYIVMDISREFIGKGQVVAMADYIYMDRDAPWKVMSSDVIVKKPLKKSAMPFINLVNVDTKPRESSQ